MKTIANILKKINLNCQKKISTAHTYGPATAIIILWLLVFKHSTGVYSVRVVSLTNK